MIGGIKVDINPITEGKTGTLATYLPGVESYLAEKQAMQKEPAVEVIPEKTVTLTVAECGEFHSLGEFAKLEELEEQNYNMIDNVLNNGAEKKEQEQTKGRISIKEKLAEKKVVIEQRDKAERTSPEKETEKKSQRTDMIGQIRQVMPHIKDSDMEELGEQVLGKLQSMTDEGFAEVVLESVE